jgi:hypothetical protein
VTIDKHKCAGKYNNSLGEKRLTERDGEGKIPSQKKFETGVGAKFKTKKYS